MKRYYNRKDGWFFTLLLVSGISLLGLYGCGKDHHDAAQAANLSIADSVYVNAGNQIASSTFDTLRKALIREMGVHGAEGALAFCNENASLLTSVYADSVSVRRTSIRFRSPGNKPDSIESSVLSDASEQMISGKLFKVKLIRDSSHDQVHFFKPILIQPMCLNCHGHPVSQITPATLVRLGQLYPNDQAVHYKENDLRGMWHIIFHNRKDISLDKPVRNAN